MTDDSMTDEEFIDIDLTKRVRLFDLCEDGSQWRERGIGQVSTQFEDKTNETFLLVHEESDDSLLLESKIEQDTAYQKMQGRFIIWTEGDTVLGLSFQENCGCEDIWQMICQVQGKDPYLEIRQVKKEDIGVGTDFIEEDDFVEEEETIEETIEEPRDVQNIEMVEQSADNVAEEVWFEEMLDIEQVELSAYERDVLEQLIDLVNRLVSPALEDKVPLPAESQLLDIFHISEDLGETEGLQQLHENILYLLSLSRDRQL